MKPKHLAYKALAASAICLGLGVAKAADVDVIATQTAFNTTYGLDTLSVNTTWTKDNVYILTDRLYVPDGLTLTIEAGTKIYSTSDDKGTTVGDDATADDSVGALIVARGGTLVANGTSSEPIIFDALQTLEAERGTDLSYDTDSVAGPKPNSMTRGLWGGVVVLGNAYVLRTDSGGNNIGDDVIEGFVPDTAIDADTDGSSDILEYGFDAAFTRDDADSSGSLQYISIRHGGYSFGPDNEINGLTLGGVGTGTTISYIEVVSNDDDGVEFFGGTVNTDHLVAIFAKDDSFDIDQGHSGTHQFWLAIQNPDAGDNLGEWDGIDGSNKDITQLAGGESATSTQIFNATLIGPGASAFTNSNTAKDNGLFIDDGFNGALRNSILTESVNFLASFSSDNKGPALAFENNIVGNFGRFSGAETTALNGAPTGFYAGGLSGVLDGNTAPATDPLFTTLTRDAGTGLLTAIDPRPTALDTTVSAGAPVTADYRGAFDGTTNWAAGWTFLEEKGYFFTPGGDTDSDGVSDTLENLIGTDPGVAQTPAEIEAAVNAYVAAQAAVAATNATATAEQSFINLGGVQATIDTQSGNAVIGFELQMSETLGNDSFQAVDTFDVGLPSGKKFYRFTPATTTDQ